MDKARRILRARGGSSGKRGFVDERAGVFSAHAEVVPQLMRSHSHTSSILRARGGSSLDLRFPRNIAVYSPRTRR